jgi:hypothetical protein
MIDKIQQVSKKLIEQLAGVGLPSQFARLYSQQTRLRNSQPGLSSWTATESDQRLSDVIRIIEAGFISLESGEIENANSSFRRGAELLEWLDHPQIRTSEFPLRILSGALYQLAGYPARATSILSVKSFEDVPTRIISNFIKADFNALIADLSHFWSNQTPPSSVEASILSEIIRSLGVIASHFRWGNWDDRRAAAQSKINDASQLMLYGQSYFAWITYKVLSHIIARYESRSLRTSMEKIIPNLSSDGTKAFEIYVRQNFIQNKSLVWPSQEIGINKVSESQSFVLCTPTGSGKTTVAEVAILKALFERQDAVSVATGHAPLILYLTPSRALATEVEGKLSRVLAQIDDGKVVVTGLYGGTDWGPTDAWLTNDSKTVLICTYEKAEALLKFIGPLFVRRISLAIVDEAHAVQLYGNAIAADSRALRLESLITRLFTFVDKSRVRLIGLSAVAENIEVPLAKWIAGDDQALPAKSDYRSTRQIIGRLEVAPNGAFIIRYDLLDKNSLVFSESGTEGPYIVEPIPRDTTPSTWRKGSAEVKLRSSLFWAALNFAAKNESGQHSSVLISVTQHVGGYAEDLLKLLEKDWAQISLPNYFSEPTDPMKNAIWEKCLRSCEDYFGDYSREYKLLKKGIIVHHGKMPGLMARLLVQLIDQKIVNVVLATSTLSEGINLPFETVLVPSLLRIGKLMPASEFMNLVGRAGRPGVGTEGRTLVVVQSAERSTSQWRYGLLKASLTSSAQLDTVDSTVGAITSLLDAIRGKWSEVFPTLNDADFYKWLEDVTPTIDEQEGDGENKKPSPETILNKSVDSLDSLLLSCLVEFERLNSREASSDDWEALIKSVWRRSFSFYATSRKDELETILLSRGTSIKTKIYSDASERKKLYRTSLSPQAGKRLVSLYTPIITHLKTGFEFSNWNADQKFDYIYGAVDLIGKHPQFKVPEKIDKTKNAPLSKDVFRWWLDPKGAPKKPTAKQVSDWYDFISKHFVYKFNWGYGSLIALIFDELHKGELKEVHLEEWPNTGLPWSAFWMKELLTWGTLNPVTSFLLARGRFTTRTQADLESADYYYDQIHAGVADANEILHPVKIRDWVLSRMPQPHKQSIGMPDEIKVTLNRDFGNHRGQEFRVIPAIRENRIDWIDYGGFVLASSDLVENWSPQFFSIFDFTLNPEKNVVTVSKYLSA